MTCTYASFCLAVGTYESYGGGTFTGQALTLEYDGSWSELSTPQPSGVLYAQLGAVACGGGSSSNCWAVGYTGTEIGGNPSDVQLSPLVMTFDSEEWTIGTAPSPNGAASALLTGVDCSSGQHCFASGYWSTAASGTNAQTLMEEWDGSGTGTDWEQDATSNPSSGSNALSAVSCGDDTPTCLAVGVQSTGSTLAAPTTLSEGVNEGGGPTETPIFDESFTHPTAPEVELPAAPDETPTVNSACLTAGTSTSATPVPGCGLPTPDADGQGTLQLTPDAVGTEGGAFYDASFPTSDGLDIGFNTYQYGDGGGDGLSFDLAAVDPADPVAPADLGAPGGGLGYAPSQPSLNGLNDGYLGVGFDLFGNYSSSNGDGTGCTDISGISGNRGYDTVTVRGPGNATTGYCALTTTGAFGRHARGLHPG